MTTPEGSPHGNPDEGADRAAWGRPPAGGWGDPSRDPAAETRSWSESAPGADDATRVDQPRPEQPREDPDATRMEQPGVWGAPGADQQGAQPQGGQVPAWAQQPPPGGGWNVPPQQGGPSGWGPPPGQYPPQPYQGQQPYPGQQGYPGQQPYPGQGYPGQQPYPGRPGPQWGQGYPPLPDAARPPRRSRVPLVVGALVVALLVIGAVLAFVSPGFLNTTVFDQAALQSGVQRVLVEDYGYGVVGDVACGAPGEAIRVTDGATFTCTTTIDGAPATVPVRVTSSTGDYEVSRPA
ncbi:hypothetical protein GCM10017691_29910 [Pseudonocardia petroleophila]|uniref:DUF4333 domain-containing protein n=1 Tax=Pseudonocardia petroleophila TaxID=37331 RepID=A0A7G7MEE0_9PSEU|nr:DUF4333 domain-containing protein [Pseudonocardia petroleophila]QNG51151.1 DUF4333 domain-containing protein [Pseudonocardia petroleophila]